MVNICNLILFCISYGMLLRNLKFLITCSQSLIWYTDMHRRQHL